VLVVLQEIIKGDKRKKDVSTLTDKGTDVDLTVQTSSDSVVKRLRETGHI